MTAAAIEVVRPFKRRKHAVDALVLLPPFGWVVIERDGAFYLRTVSTRPASVLQFLQSHEEHSFREVPL